MNLTQPSGKAINLTHATNLGVRVYLPLHRPQPVPSVRDTSTPVQLYIRLTARSFAPADC